MDSTIVVPVVITPEELKRCNRLLDIQDLITAKLCEAHGKLVEMVEGR